MTPSFLKLIIPCRKRQDGRDGNAGSLPGWRFSVSNYLYCRSDGVAGHVISTCIVSLLQPIKPVCFLASVTNASGPLIIRQTLTRCSCFVRARRLNVIIQPHLRFTYELLKWDEVQHQKRGEPTRRDLEWATVTREIAAMNKPYLK